MPAYRFGEIVLVPFPFTDQTGSKKRPAVVVSSTTFNSTRRDLLIMAVTSQLRPLAMFGEIFVRDWQAAKLLKPSAIKPVITTIEQALVIRGLGTLTPHDQEALRNTIATLFG